MEIRDGRLLDILMEERIHKGLEKALNNNELYQSAQEEVDKAIKQLENAGLSREQNKVVDKAISAANASEPHMEQLLIDRDFMMALN